MGSLGINGNTTGLHIIVVGAGIAGLAVATTLSQKGHSVTVLEAKPALNEFGASIGISSNGVRPLKAWGLEKDFRKVVTANGALDVRDGLTNEPLGCIFMNKKDYSKINYVDEKWSINRQDYQATLAKTATENGAKIMFNADTVSVDVDKCVVKLRDGRELEANVIIGADGVRSAVRYSIPKLSEVDPLPWEETAFRCEVPKERMYGNPKLEWLLHVGDEFCWSTEGRYVLAWPLPPNRKYDVVTCIKRPSDVPPGRWGVRCDPEEARKDFQDFCPEVRELLSEIDSAVSWRLAELPPLETFRSDNGRVVLMGDAAHAMIPHSGSGGNSSIEDAACLSECLDWAFRNHKDLAVATKAYEDIRKPRVERMMTASHEGYNFLGADGDFLPIRNQAIREQTRIAEAELDLPDDVRRANAKEQKPDMNAPFPSAEYLSWLYNHDAIAVAKEYLTHLE